MKPVYDLALRKHGVVRFTGLAGGVPWREPPGGISRRPATLSMPAVSTVSARDVLLRVRDGSAAPLAESMEWRYRRWREKGWI